MMLLFACQPEPPVQQFDGSIELFFRPEIRDMPVECGQSQPVGSFDKRDELEPSRGFARIGGGSFSWVLFGSHGFSSSRVMGAMLSPVGSRK